MDKIDGEEEIATEIELADNFKEEMYDVIVKLEGALTPGSTADPSHSTPAASRAAGTAATHMKLNIRPFNGEITAWTPFWESYQSAIHTIPDLTDTEKFNYLGSLLESTALESISAWLVAHCIQPQGGDFCFREEVWKQAENHHQTHGHAHGTSCHHVVKQPQGPSSPLRYR